MNFRLAIVPNASGLFLALSGLLGAAMPGYGKDLFRPLNLEMGAAPLQFKSWPAPTGSLLPSDFLIRGGNWGCFPENELAHSSSVTRGVTWWILRGEQASREGSKPKEVPPCRSYFCRVSPWAQPESDRA